MENISREKQLVYCRYAVDTVIRYAREQGVKLREQVVADVGIGNKWKHDLSVAVADNYVCKTFSCGAKMIVFYRYKADILIARRVFTYLFKVGNRLANRYVKKYREEQWGSAAEIYNSFVRLCSRGKKGTGKAVYRPYLCRTAGNGRVMECLFCEFQDSQSKRYGNRWYGIQRGHCRGQKGVERTIFGERGSGRIASAPFEFSERSNLYEHRNG